MLKIEPPKENSIEKLISFLLEKSFIIGKSKSKTWRKIAYKVKNQKAIFILIRKNGIDYRIFNEYKNEVCIDDKCLISIHGGSIFRNHYSKSNCSLIEKTRYIALKFNCGIFDSNIYTEDGISYKLLDSYDNIRSLSKQRYNRSCK